MKVELFEKKVMKLVDEILEKINNFVKKHKLSFVVKNSLILALTGILLREAGAEFVSKTSIQDALTDDELAVLAVRLNDLLREIHDISESLVERYENLPKKATSRTFITMGLLATSLAFILKKQADELSKDNFKEEFKSRIVV